MKRERGRIILGTWLGQDSQSGSNGDGTSLGQGGTTKTEGLGQEVGQPGTSLDLGSKKGGTALGQAWDNDFGLRGQVGRESPLKGGSLPTGSLRIEDIAMIGMMLGTLDGISKRGFDGDRLSELLRQAANGIEVNTEEIHAEINRALKFCDSGLSGPELVECARKVFEYRSL